MDFEHRGKPPYKVSSGIVQWVKAPEHWSGATTYANALEIIADVSDFGKDNWQQRIVDSLNTTVFEVNNPRDRAMLREADITGINVIPKKP